MYKVMGSFRQNGNIVNEEVVGVFDDVESAKKFAQVQLNVWDAVWITKEGNDED